MCGAVHIQSWIYLLASTREVAFTNGSVTPTCFQPADTFKHVSLLALGPKVTVLVQPVVIPKRTTAIPI